MLVREAIEIICTTKRYRIMSIPQLPSTCQVLRNYLAAIPESDWCMHTVNNGKGQHCALGHLDKAGLHRTWCIFTEGLQERIDMWRVNDRQDKNYPQPTPKLRVLAMLDDLIIKGY